MKKQYFYIRKICYLAILIVLEIVLNRFCSINTPALKIGFSFIAVATAAVLFGPVSAAIVGALADFLGAILFPIGPYHVGFTLCAAACGFIYGLFLHIPKEDEKIRLIKWKKIRFFPNIAVPAVVNNLIFGLLLNTIWVSQLYTSKMYPAWLVFRLPEYAVLIPLNLILIPFIIKLCEILERNIRWKL